MADYEHLLITSIIDSKDLHPVLESKVTKDFFADPEHREVFVWVMSFWTEYGKVPGPRAVKGEFPTYRLTRGQEPYRFYLDQVRRRRRWALMFETMQDAGEAFEEDDVDETINVLRSGIMRAETEVSELRDANLITTWEQRLERYEEREKYGHLLKGIPSGFTSLDDGLRGFQEQQLITFVGGPKAGKSWMMLNMALAAHDAGRLPLFLGFEMGNNEQMERADCVVAGISYTRLLKGELTSEEKERLRETLYRRRSAHEFIFSADPSGSTVSGALAKVDQYKPDILFIDGVYMMDDEEGEARGTAQALTNITRSLKKSARSLNIPIVISTQILNWKVNRKRGIDENSVGYSSSFLQDSDVLIGMENTDPDNPNDPMKRVKILLARTAPKFEMLLLWDWETTAVTEIREEDAEGGYGVEDEDEEDEVRITKDTWDRKRKVVRRAKVRTEEDE